AARSPRLLCAYYPQESRAKKKQVTTLVGCLAAQRLLLSEVHDLLKGASHMAYNGRRAAKKMEGRQKRQVLTKKQGQELRTTPVAWLSRLMKRTTGALRQKASQDCRWGIVTRPVARTSATAISVRADGIGVPVFVGVALLCEGPGGG